jgi:DNA-binding NarL/FixJ family response regulator
MKTVVIIEDQTAVREMIAHVVESDPGFNVIAQAGDGESGFEICRREQPDLVILDLMLPGVGGAEVMRRIFRQLKGVRVVVFSGYYTPPIVRELLTHGAQGFVEKNAPLQELKNAIRAVAGGGTYFGPEVSKVVRQTMVTPSVADEEPTLADLSAREVQVLRLIAQGATNKDIAQRLNVSMKTVDNHRANLMRKLHLHKISELTRFALDQGLVRGDSTSQKF